MFEFFRRKVDLKDRLRATKKIVVDGAKLEIKKIDPAAHLSGLNVLYKIYDVYKVEKNRAPEKAEDDLKKIKKTLRDIIFAGVVSPQLTLKGDEPEKIHIDEILSDLPLAQKIAKEILSLTYGKKN